MDSRMHGQRILGHPQYKNVLQSLPLFWPVWEVGKMREKVHSTQALPTLSILLKINKWSLPGG